MDAARKREYNATLSDYQRKKYNKYRKDEYHNFTEEEKAKLLAKRKVYYEANKENKRKAVKILSCQKESITRSFFS